MTNPPNSATVSRDLASARAAGSRTVLHIDWTRCDGHGACVELLPGAFAADEWGFPIPRGERIRGDVVIGASEVEHAERAVSACPLMALRIHRLHG